MKNLIKDTPVEVAAEASVGLWKFLDKPRGKCKRDDSNLIAVIFWVVVLGVIPAIKHFS